MEDPKYTIAAWFSSSEIEICVRFAELVAPGVDWRNPAKGLDKMTPAEAFKAIRWEGSPKATR
jgi:hypothetical protein